jgi:hypothetical protein
MPPMLSPMSQSSIAYLALISMIDVSQCPINHAIAIEVSVFGVAHLTQSKVIAIGIDCFHTPIAFLGYQYVKAFHLLPIDNS